MNPDTKRSVAGRLAKIEGQVRGLGQMLEADRYCLDVVAQVRAARAALARVEQAILADHLAECVEQAVLSGDPERQRRKVAELIDVFARAEA